MSSDEVTERTSIIYRYRTDTYVSKVDHLGAYRMGYRTKIGVNWSALFARLKPEPRTWKLPNFGALFSSCLAGLRSRWNRNSDSPQGGDTPAPIDGSFPTRETLFGSDSYESMEEMGAANHHMDGELSRGLNVRNLDEKEQAAMRAVALGDAGSAAAPGTGRARGQNG